MAERKRKWDVEASSTEKKIKGDELDPIAVALNAASRISAQITKLGQGPFIEELDINGAQNRLHLTKGTTLQELRQSTGTSITVRGIYVPPGSNPPPGEKSLHFNITAPTKESLDATIAKIKSMMVTGGGGGGGHGHGYGSSGFTERVYIDIDVNDAKSRGLNVFGKILGTKGANVKYISSESGAKVILKEGENQQAGAEPMHILITGSSQEVVNKAKTLAENLLRTIKTQYEELLRSAPATQPQAPSQTASSYYQSYSQAYPGYDYYQSYGYQYPYGYYPPQPPSAPPPPPPPEPAPTPDFKSQPTNTLPEMGPARPTSTDYNYDLPEPPPPPPPPQSKPAPPSKLPSTPPKKQPTSSSSSGSIKLVDYNEDDKSNSRVTSSQSKAQAPFWAAPPPTVQSYKNL